MDVSFTVEEEVARDAEETAWMAERARQDRASLLARAIDLDARLAAAQRLAATIPEAAGEALRLQGELEAVKVELGTLRA